MSRSNISVKSMDKSLSKSTTISSSSSSSSSVWWYDTVQSIQRCILENSNDELYHLTWNLLHPSTSVSVTSFQEQPKEGTDQVLPESVQNTLEKILCQSLLQDEKFQDIIDYCTTKKKTLPSHLTHEYAYALYRLEKYDTCRTILLPFIGPEPKKMHDHEFVGEDPFSPKFVWMHLVAQCYFHLNEMQAALHVYQDLLRILPNFGSSSSSERPTQNMIQEILINAWAVLIANHTYTANPNVSSIQDILVPTHQILGSWEEKLGGRDMEETNSSYPYDLAYNFASFLFIHHSSSAAKIHQALQLLSRAEKKFQEESQQNQEDEVQDTDCIVSKEDITLIRSNIGYGKILLGDYNGAIQIYQDLLHLHSHSPLKNSLSPWIHKMMDHNLIVASFLQSSISIEDVEIQFSSHILEIKKNNISSSVSFSLPSWMKKMNAHQRRVIFMNYILILLQRNQYKECQSMIDLFQESVLCSKYQDRIFLSHAPIKQESGQKNNKEKHKMKDVNRLLDIHTLTQEQELVWLARIAIVESELVEKIGKSDQDNKNHTTKIVEDSNLQELLSKECVEKKIQHIIHQIQTSLQRLREKKDQETEDTVIALEFALSEIKLYQVQKETRSRGKKNTMDAQQFLLSTIENLPPTIQMRPASIAVQLSLFRELGLTDKCSDLMAKVSSESECMVKKQQADLKLSLGLYDEAVTIYESIIDTIVEDDISIQCKASLVKALSYIDAAKASAYLSTFEPSLTYTMWDEVKDGETLEFMNIPRISGSTAGRRVMSALQKADETENDDKTKKKQLSLQRRAVKRQKYLKKLELEGRYNPDHPTKPDPERWIPKSQRSYNKRGRKARNAFVGAQGAGAATEKEASKLDVAARVTAKALAQEIGSSKPSTAHLNVSSSGPVKSRRR